MVSCTWLHPGCWLIARMDYFYFKIWNVTILLEDRLCYWYLIISILLAICFAEPQWKVILCVIYLTERRCPNITITNSVGVTNLPGVYETRYHVICVSGYVITGDATSYNTTCQHDRTWSHIEHCQSKKYLSALPCLEAFHFILRGKPLVDVGGLRQKWKNCEQPIWKKNCKCQGAENIKYKKVKWKSLPEAPHKD